MRRRLLLRAVSVVVIAVLALPLGLAGQLLANATSVATAGSPTCDTSLSLSPIGFGVLPAGMKGHSYGTDITVTGGGGPTYYWHLKSGSLPPGLTWSADAQGFDDATLSISGTTTDAGVYPFTLAVADYDNGTICLDGAEADYQITVYAMGQVTIALGTQPKSGIDVGFTGDLGNFALDNDSAGLPPDKILFLVPIGDYAVTETDPAGTGYQLTAIKCTANGVSNLATRTLSLSLEEGDNLTCTFTNVFRRVDLEIAKSAAGPFKGGNIYATTATAAQTQTRAGVSPGAHDYFIRIGNDGPKADRFLVKGTATGSSQFNVSYFYGGVNVTTLVKNGTWQTRSLMPGGSVMLDARVVEKAGASVGAAKTVIVRAASVGRTDQVDVVRAVTSR
jgi:hypothetical protein